MTSVGLQLLTCLVLSTLLLVSEARDLKQVQTINYQGIYVLGDSISRGYNADKANCNNADQPDNAWVTGGATGLSITGTTTAVYSYGERAIATAAANNFKSIANYAFTGGRVTRDLVNNATALQQYLLEPNKDRTLYRNKIIIFSGHNDYCSGIASKTATSCSDASRDPAMYCTVKADSFDSKLREALQILVTIPNTTIVLNANLRVGQLCNFRDTLTTKAALGITMTCKSFWGIANTVANVGICLPLTGGSSTKACTTARLEDSYTVLDSYRTKISAAATWANGLGTKAEGVEVKYNSLPWYMKIPSKTWVSPCDCFHPEKLGQDMFAQVAFNGLTCSSTTPCCKDYGGSVSKLSAAACNSTVTSSLSYPGM